MHLVPVQGLCSQSFPFRRNLGTLSVLLVQGNNSLLRQSARPACVCLTTLVLVAVKRDAKIGAQKRRVTQQLVLFNTFLLVTRLQRTRHFRRQLLPDLLEELLYDLRKVTKERHHIDRTGHDLHICKKSYRLRYVDPTARQNP